MKRLNSYSYLIRQLVIAAIAILSYSCEKNLQSEEFARFSGSTFFQTPDDAKSAVTATYRRMIMSFQNSDYGQPIMIQSSMTTGELAALGEGVEFPKLDFREDNDGITVFYLIGMPIITEATINIDKISQMKMDNTALQGRLIAELTALRAYYSQILFNLYGPVPIRIDPKVAEDPSSESIPRPTNEWMVAQIEKDYKDAAAVLPATYATSDDYGRWTKGACLTGLMKLYMHEKRWTDAIAIGEQIKGMNYALLPNYADIFSYSNKEGNSEIILAISININSYNNDWLGKVLVSSYLDPNGITLPMDGYMFMPWKTYDKFDQKDKRLQRLLAKWPTSDGKIVDGRAEGYSGAIPMKYEADPTSRSIIQGTDIVIWRYADVMLLLAEAINESQGPNSEAHSLINAIRTRAGLSGYPVGTLNKDQFKSKIMDERLFELWCEDGILKDDMIRWGTFIQNALNNGSTSAKPEFTLYPLPRSVISESNGVIKQNPGY